MKRIIMMLALSAFLVAALSVSALSAFAAPINCPSSQTAEKVGGEWRCVNPSGNTSGADKPKNPNRR
jgi:hypothetical protein